MKSAFQNIWNSSWVLKHEDEKPLSGLLAGGSQLFVMIFCRDKPVLNGRWASLQTRLWSSDMGAANEGNGRWGKKSSFLWLQSGSCRSLMWIIPSILPCAICPWCRGGVKCVTPFILRGGRAVSRTENALFPSSQHKRLFYSCLAIHLSRCLRLC